MERDDTSPHSLGQILRELLGSGDSDPSKETLRVDLDREPVDAFGNRAGLHINKSRFTICFEIRFAAQKEAKPGRI